MLYPHMTYHHPFVLSHADRLRYLVTSPPVVVTMPETNIVEIKVEACLKGTEISIQQMSVDTSHASEAKAQTFQFLYEETACK